MKAAIFDMDGTLVDSTDLAYHAAHEGLTAYWTRRGLPASCPSRDDVRRLVGLPSLEYFSRLVPEAHRTDACEIRDLVFQSELARLSAGEGRLFPGVRETLASMRQAGWKLAIVSNCGRRYLEANLEHQGLRAMVDGAFCLDDRPSKTENVRAALEFLGRRDGVMVGDRAADLEAGRANGLRTIGCAYGFGCDGELDGADARISSIGELMGLLVARE